MVAGFEPLQLPVQIIIHICTVPLSEYFNCRSYVKKFLPGVSPKHSLGCVGGKIAESRTFKTLLQDLRFILVIFIVFDGNDSD